MEDKIFSPYFVQKDVFRSLSEADNEVTTFCVTQTKWRLSKLWLSLRSLCLASSFRDSFLLTTWDTHNNSVHVWAGLKWKKVIFTSLKDGLRVKGRQEDAVSWPAEDIERHSSGLHLTSVYMCVCVCVCFHACILVLVHWAAFVTFIDNRQFAQQRCRLLRELLKNLQPNTQHTHTPVLCYVFVFSFDLFKWDSDQSLVEPVAVVVVQTSSKIVRQLTGFNVTSQLIGRDQDHLTGSTDMKRAFNSKVFLSLADILN